MTAKLKRSGQWPLFFHVDKYLEKENLYLVSEINKIQQNWREIETYFGTDLHLELFENADGTFTIFECGTYVIVLELNFAEDEGRMIFMDLNTRNLKQTIVSISDLFVTKLSQTINFDKLILKPNDTASHLQFSFNALLNILR